MKIARAVLLSAGLIAGVPHALAQQLDTRFSCSSAGDDHGDPVLRADSGRIKIEGDRIDAFRWESSLHRQTHGFDCSIDDEDGLRAEFSAESGGALWRVTLADALMARARRGYDYAHGLNCSIRLRRAGDVLSIVPSCPALCGSRPNFSGLSINLKTGACRYEQ